MLNMTRKREREREREREKLRERTWKDIPSKRYYILHTRVKC